MILPPSHGTTAAPRIAGRPFPLFLLPTVSLGSGIAFSNGHPGWRAMSQYQDFDADEFQRLPLKERVKRCLEHARQAERLGKAAQGEHRVAYGRLARQWRLLAEEIRRASFH